MAPTAQLEQEREPHAAPAPAEVDLRVLQANERTLLAWVRTSIALLGFGFAVAKFGTLAGGLQPHSSIWLAGGFLAAGIGTNVVAALRYLAIRRALETARPLPSDKVSVTLFIGLVTLLGVALAGWVFATS